MAIRMPHLESMCCRFPPTLQGGGRTGHYQFLAPPPFGTLKVMTPSTPYVWQESGSKIMRNGAEQASGRKIQRTVMNGDRTFERIEALFDVQLLAPAKVFVAGCGSGGGSVALHLAMSGIQNFILLD